MARGVGRSGSGRAVLNELSQEVDPPQSTLAAQLVSHFTDGKKHPRDQDEETFRQLLREILGTESGQAVRAEPLETDSDVDYKLIYVVVKAGLERIILDDPFNGKTKLRRQATDSLTAINFTIKRNPEVLFVAPQLQGLDPRPIGPLYLWLLPRLLALIGCLQDSETIDGILRVFTTFLIVERKTHVRRVNSRPVLRYMKGCIDDLLSHLETESSDPASKPKMPLYRVPSGATVSGLCPEGLPQNELQSAVGVFFGHRKQLINTIMCLLSLLTIPSPSRPGVISSDGFLTPYDSWVLSVLTRFWEAIAPEGTQLDYNEIPVSSTVTFLDCIRAFLARITSLNSRSAIVSRVSRLCSHITTNFLVRQSLPLPTSVEKRICLIAFDLTLTNLKSESKLQSFAGDTLPILLEVKEDHKRFEAFGQDLQYAIYLVILLHEQKSHDKLCLLPSCQMPSFQEPDIRQTSHSYFCNPVPDTGTHDVERPSKRARLTAMSRDKSMDSLRSNIVSNIYSLLGLPVNTALTGLSENAADCFPGLSEGAQCSLYAAIGQLACASAQSMSETSVGDHGRLVHNKCYNCDTEMKDNNISVPWEGAASEAVFSTIVSLIKLPKFQRFRKPRVAAMLALKRLLSHTAKEEHLDLTTSVFGQWCLQALQSSLRELRIAAGRTIPVFMQSALNPSVVLKNRHIALEFLRTLSGQKDIALQETSILAWGQIARVSSGDEMNLILLKLVEYLGHTNALLSGLAYDEIQKLANHSQFSAMKLFAPYWRTIAVSVIQDIHRRPQAAQQISDLLAMSVSEFLSMTQVHTVPFFVLTKKQDVLQRIADACGQSIMALCREHNNLAAILSCVLLRTSSDVESLVMSLLNAVSPEFGNVDCPDLLKSEPQSTASELLKAAGENDEIIRAKAYQALHFLAETTHGKSVSGRGTARKVDSIGPFFETHVLGIMALLADTINDGKGPQPILEKIRCLGAIREMIKLAKSHVSNGLPQICACLRSAIENKDLSNQGFDAWIVMMTTLGEDDIAMLVDPTFAIIVQHWDSFLAGIQEQAYAMIGYLLKSHSSMICDIVHTLPSLAAVPLMAKFEGELGRLKARMDVKHHYQSFSQRCQNENATVVFRALSELAEYLVVNQGFLHETANSEQPDPVVGQLVRSLLDTSVLFSNTHPEISVLCAKCIGLVGCLDPTRIEAVREKKEILVLSNFVRDDETNDFIIFFLREVLVKAFLSATNSRSQGFLAYSMQELLSISDIKESVRPRPRDAPFDANYRRWVSLPESVRTILMPFTKSKYFVTAGVSQPPSTYPLYDAKMGHGQWLRTFAFDLLRRKVGVGNVQIIFSVLSRIIRFQDISISNFLLRFACLNVIINSKDQEKLDIGRELLLVLHEPLPENRHSKDNIILCSQTVFQVLDYLSRWMQEKKKEIANAKSAGMRSGRLPSEADLEQGVMQIQSVETVLSLIPADVISRRAVECKSFSRALFHWEQFIRQQRDDDSKNTHDVDLEPLYERLQEIYTQIDEPDGIEGISAHLQVLNIDQQILEHRKAGRWTAAQSWYEILLTKKPKDFDVQLNLLTCLKESGQHDVLLNQVDGFQKSDATCNLSLPFAAEASWVTGKWDKLEGYLSMSTEASDGDFNVGIGRALLALSKDNISQFLVILDQLRRNTLRGLSATNTASLQGCHDTLLKFHALAEIEMIGGAGIMDKDKKSSLVSSMDQRLNVLGPFVSDKQYLLGLRRAAMQLCRRHFSNADIASAWLTSAKLARKGDFTHQAFNAVLHASQLGDASATIEHSRLLWKEGSHRKAIQSLEGAIGANAFRSHDYLEADESLTTNNPGLQQQQNLLKARAHLLLAKWIDRAGQTQSDVIIHQYNRATEFHNRWEKGHYYLGKHYNKLLESEKAKPPWKQAQTFIQGETAKLVIENYLRSLAFGAKYIYQTMPRILTLWLDLAFQSDQSLDPSYGNDETFRSHTMAHRRKLLGACNSQIKKYCDRLPAFAWYTALSQIVARICHPNHAVYNLLADIVTKVVIQHTPQALWALLAVVKSFSKERASRGMACLTRILENAKKSRVDSTGIEVKTLISQGQKLTDQLLHVCECNIPNKPTMVSLTKDLGFNHKTASSKLAIPLESSLTASIPANDSMVMRTHKAFNSRDYVYISSFLDEVTILNSLQRPRKISIRGSDGHVYALLCKPKDDLRKDQRLMEFNAMINRSLKKDAESSKRRLYIKTYAVTPLNEECGLIEWVDNLKTLREIVLNSYKQKNVQINYGDLRNLLNESVTTPAKLSIFTDRIIPSFPPVFHEWFIEMFPEPGAWFIARLRYTRSCAVMSIVGHVLGLGDRHGENILFEESNGGTFHVDFNCLFDKGLTFEKPELVPFRLTHNMVDAFGAYGYEGPFRKSCELTLGILRQHEDTLMTILETFLYDPTTDFIGKKKKTVPVVPDTPEGVLESVRNKVHGLLPMESVPLSVEGYVQALIQQATDPFKLASMYIGWCAFF